MSVPTRGLPPASARFPPGATSQNALFAGEGWSFEITTTFTLKDIDRAQKGVSSEPVRQYLTMLHSLGDIY